jgi:hypothetical protein
MKPIRKFIHISLIGLVGFLSIIAILGGFGLADHLYRAGDADRHFLARRLADRYPHGANMKFSGVCLVTSDVPALADFYSRALGVCAEGDAQQAVLHTEGAGLAIFT